VGCILDEPDPPRLVIFLPASEAARQGPRGAAAAAAAESGYLLVIEINKRVRVNPDLCDCRHDSTGQGQRGAQPTPPFRNGILSLDTLDEDHGQQPPLPRQSQPQRRRQQQQQQQPGCRKVVLEVFKKSGIAARETDTDSDSAWNLAGAGRYQDGEGLARVKRLRKVVLVFGSVEERVRFVKEFTDLRELYLADLSAATG